MMTRGLDSSFAPWDLRPHPLTENAEFTCSQQLVLSWGPIVAGHDGARLVEQEGIQGTLRWQQHTQAGEEPSTRAARDGSSTQKQVSSYGQGTLRWQQHTQAGGQLRLRHSEVAAAHTSW